MTEHIKNIFVSTDVAIISGSRLLIFSCRRLLNKQPCGFVLCAAVRGWIIKEERYKANKTGNFNRRVKE